MATHVSGTGLSPSPLWPLLNFQSKVKGRCAAQPHRNHVIGRTHFLRWPQSTVTGNSELSPKFGQDRKVEFALKRALYADGETTQFFS